MYLDKCICSIVNQILKVIEIILVDDASSNKSEVIYKKYEVNDNRIKFLRKNGGVSSARNYRVDISKDKFIIFVNSVYYIEVDMCKKLYT